MRRMRRASFWNRARAAGAAIVGAAVLAAGPLAAQETESLADDAATLKAAARLCDAVLAGTPTADATSGLQVLAETLPESTPGLTFTALRGLRGAAIVAHRQGPPPACWIAPVDDFGGAEAHAFVTAATAALGPQPSAAPAPAAPPPPAAAAPTPPPIQAPPPPSSAPVGVSMSRQTPDGAMAPLAAAWAVRQLCAEALLTGQPIAQAAAAAGLAPTDAPAFPLPNANRGAALFTAPSVDGAVFVYDDPENPRRCNVAVAFAPAIVGRLMIDALTRPEVGFRLGQTGSVANNAALQQLTMPGNRAFANVVTYPAPDIGAAPSVQVYVQVGTP